MAEGYRKHQIVSGAVILIALGIFLYFAFKLGTLDPRRLFGKDPLHCISHLTDVRTLKPGAKVAVGGKEVGEVTSIRFVSRELVGSDLEDTLKELREMELDPDGLGAQGEPFRWQVIEIRFVVTDPELRLDTATAHVRLGQDGFLGAHFVDLDPGIWRGEARPPLALDVESADDAPVTIRTGGLTGLDLLIKEASPMLKRVESMLTKIDQRLLGESNIKALEDMMRDLKRAAAQARGILTRADGLLDPAVEDGLHAKLLDPTRALLETSRERIDEVLRYVLRETLEKQVKALMARAEETAGSATTTIDRLRETLDENDARVRRLLDNLVAATDDLDSRIGSLQDRTEKLLDETRGIMTDNRANLAESMRRMRRSMWHLEMAIRKVRANPGVVLWGDDEALMNAREFDEEAIRRSGRARPYGQRDESDDGR